jgi:protein involved in polysaccharide export with SLBB domain
MVVHSVSLRKLLLGTGFFAVAFLSLALSGCVTPVSRTATEETMVPPVLVLAPGDAVEISFPGATNLSGIRRIGPEGAITMPIIGPVQATGKTVAELETELERLYDKELNDKDIVVALAGSANVVYVTGLVGRPGRVGLDRPMTAMEAILEAGGFLPNANMKKVAISRYEGTENVTFVINLDPLFKGGPVSKFYLHPRDVIFVPKKIQWF